MTLGHWRAKFRPIIREALEATKGKTPEEIRKAVVDAYPLSERKYWPYKVWCDEVRVQKGLRIFGAGKARRAAIKAGQGDLWKERAMNTQAGVVLAALVQIG